MAKIDLAQRTLHNMTLHPPSGPEVTERMDRLRTIYKTAAQQTIDYCPEGRELSMALTSLEDALQYGIAAIARNQDA